MYPRLRIFAFGKFSNPVSNSTDRMNPGLAFDRHRLVMPGQVRAGIPRTGSGVPIATEKKTSIFIGSVVGLQECLDPLPQLGIAHAFFAIQNFGAFHGVIVVGSLQENGLHALRVKRHADNWCLRIIGVSSVFNENRTDTCRLPSSGILMNCVRISDSRRILRHGARERLDSRSLRSPGFVGPYFFHVSRTRGNLAKVKSKTSSPVTVLMSWCKLTTLTPVTS